MKIIVLGVGSSGGTPQIGCTCATCTSSNPKNKRTRSSSVVVLESGEHILIDTGPDLRQQALREDIRRVDAVLYTHAHADHLNGIDDLRAFCVAGRRQIPVYGNTATIHNMTSRFGYAFLPPREHWDLPTLIAHEVSEPFDLFGQRIIPLPVQHGRSSILGWRVGNFAYLTDISSIPEETKAMLKGVEILLLDCLRTRPHHTHINLEQSLELAAMISAERTFLIHMTHELEYHGLSTQLPDGIYVGYDGLRLELA